MLERVILLVAIAAVVTLAVAALRARSAQTTRKLAERVLWEPLGQAPDGRPTLVDFSTPSCTACEQAQAPAVAAVELRLGADALRVIHIDASREPAVASAFGVLTVPTTAVLAPSGRLVAINHGFASTRKLVEQLQRA